MATLFSDCGGSTTPGNFTAAATWDVIHESSYTTNNSILSSVTLATGTNYSTPTITFSGVTLSSIGLNIRGLVTAPSGTITIALYDSSNVLVANSSNTYNLNLIAGTGISAEMGWFFFRLRETISLTGNFYARVTVSVSSQIALRTASTNPNTTLARAFVTNVGQAPAVGDVLFTSGELFPTVSGANISTTNIFQTRTVNVDNTATTSFGNSFLCNRGVLKWERTITPDTYTLRLAGNLSMYHGSILDMGTLAEPIGTGYTAVLEFNIASNSQYNFVFLGGTFYGYGLDKTTAVTLGANQSASATSATLSSAPSGWVNGDQIYFTGTTKFSGSVFNDDLVTLTATPTTATIAHTAVTNAREGTASTYVQAHAVNFTRNVIIRTVNSTFKTTLGSTLLSVATLDIVLKNVDFQNIGFTSNFNWSLSQTTVTPSFDNVVFRMTNTSNTISFFPSSFFPSTMTINNCIFYQGNGNIGGLIAVKIDDGNFFLKNTNGVCCNNIIGSNNVYFANSTTGCASRGSSFKAGATNNIFYNNNTSAVQIPVQMIASQTQTDFKIWRNAGGISFGSDTGTTLNGLARSYLQVLSNFRIFGNTTNFLCFTPSSGGTDPKGFGRVMIRDSYIYGEGTNSAYGIDFNASGNTTVLEYIQFYKCTFGFTDIPVQSNFTTAIIRGSSHSHVVLTDCTFATSGVQEYAVSGGTKGDPIYSSLGILSLKHNGVVGQFRMWQKWGYIWNESGGGIRIYPQSVTHKTYTNYLRVPVKTTDGACTISVTILRSSANQGNTNYTTAVSLILQSNPLASDGTNYLADISSTLSGVSVPPGTAETLTLNVPAVTVDSVLEFYIECIGTAGFVIVKDWIMTNASNNVLNNDTRAYQFIGNDGAYVDVQYDSGSTPIGSGGGSFAFFG